MSAIDSIIKTAITGRTSTNYTVGGKSSGIPFDVKLSLDQDFKNTVIKGVGIFSLSVFGGIVTGIVISKAIEKRR